MQASQLPTRLPIPFANTAGSGFIRSVPTASQIGIANGAASLADGFPPLCFQPVGSGGIPPAGQDFNGILNLITAWTRWQASGGTVPFDQIFANAIGGYPYGAIVQSTTSGKLWLNVADNNLTNPDSGGAASWIAIGAGSGIGLLNIQVITASGTYTKTPGAKKAIVLGTGGGGAGGSSNSGVGTSADGQGGESGATALSLVDLTSTTTVACTIGAGGAPSVAAAAIGTRAGSGGQTSFGPFAIAPGGQGGLNCVKDYVAAGGTTGGTANLLMIRGNPGEGVIATSTGQRGGAGGSSIWGGGGLGGEADSNGSSTASAGFAATGYGSGGGGADVGGNTAALAGGAGMPGIIFIVELG